MKNLFILSFRYTSDINNLIGGDASFLNQFLETISKLDEYKITVISLQYKGTKPWQQHEGYEVVRLPINHSLNYSLLDLHHQPETEIVRTGIDFGEEAFRYVKQIADPGDVCILNDFFENGDVRDLKAKGLKLIQICHILPSEYVFHEYMRDIFSGEKSEMKKRFPAYLYHLIKFYSKHIKTHKGLVQFTKFLIENKIEKIIPKTLRTPFVREYESMNYCDKVVVPTTAMQKKVLDCYQVPPEKIQIVPWGVKDIQSRDEINHELDSLIKEYELADNKMVITTLSRISPEKGIEFLLEALTTIENNYPDLAERLEVFICGRPTLSRGQVYYEDLKTRAQKLKTVRVHFPGFVSGARKSAFLYLSDIYVFASKYESFGLTLLEAMLHETAVISSDTDGARDVVKPDFGIILPFTEKESRVSCLAEAIKKFSKSDLSTMGKEAALHCENYKWPRISREILSL